MPNFLQLFIHIAFLIGVFTFYYLIYHWLDYDSANIHFHGGIMTLNTCVFKCTTQIFIQTIIAGLIFTYDSYIIINSIRNIAKWYDFKKCTVFLWNAQTNHLQYCTWLTLHVTSALKMFQRTRHKAWNIFLYGMCARHMMAAHKMVCVTAQSKFDKIKLSGDACCKTAVSFDLFSSKRLCLLWM